MNALIFGFVAGIVLTIAGASVFKDFWKFLGLAIILGVTHHLTME